jgi:hypothetical protein
VLRLCVVYDDCIAGRHSAMWQQQDDYVFLVRGMATTMTSTKNQRPVGPCNDDDAFRSDDRHDTQDYDEDQ